VSPIFDEEPNSIVRESGNTAVKNRWILSVTVSRRNGVISFEDCGRAFLFETKIGLLVATQKTARRPEPNQDGYGAIDVFGLAHGRIRSRCDGKSRYRMVCYSRNRMNL
jgi:hypothetical protein